MLIGSNFLNSFVDIEGVIAKLFAFAFDNLGEKCNLYNNIKWYESEVAVGTA